MLADDDYKLKAIVEMLQSKFIKRNISLKALQYGKAERPRAAWCARSSPFSRGSPRRRRRRSLPYQGNKLKVQAQIQDDQVRVTGKNIDDLQEVIRLLKGKDLDVEMQYVNFRQ